MPLIEITLAEGRSPEQLRALISEATAAAVRTVGVRLEQVRVVLREVPTTHWAAGDVTIAERQAAAAQAASSETGNTAEGTTR